MTLIRSRGSMLLLAIIFCISQNIQAQSIQLLVDPLNPYQKSSLFNLSVLNTGNYSGQLNLKATLKSRRGKTLMVQELKESISQAASKSLRGASVNARTTFIDGDFDQLYGSSNMLPPLNYVLCIEAIAVGDISIRAEECVDYQASDFINITAVYPPNEIEIYDQRPTFNWVDINPHKSYTYNFKLVAVPKGQNENVAVRRNEPIVLIEGLTQNQLTFPADAKALENGVEYAWQITTNYKGEAIAQSEPFTFRYKEEEKYIDIPRNLSYVDITELDQGANLYAVGEFKFKFPSDIDNELTAELYELKKNTSTGSATKKQIDLTEATFEVKKGVNKYELDLKDQAYLKHLKKYELLIKDEKQRRSYQMIIQYINPDYIAPAGGKSEGMVK